MQEVHHLVQEAFPGYSSVIESSRDPEGSFQHRFARGHGRVALLWDKSLNNVVSELDFPRNPRIVGFVLSVPIRIWLFSHAIFPPDLAVLMNLKQFLMS